MTTSQAVIAVANNLRSHPLAFALVIINVLFLLASVLVLRDVALNARERAEAENNVLVQILHSCGTKNGSKQ